MHALLGLWFEVCGLATAFTYVPAGRHWQLGCADLPVRAVCRLFCRSAVAGVSVLLQSRILLLVSLAEQDHILQHWGEHAAVPLADTVKNLRRHQCSQNVQFDVCVLWASGKFCGLQGIVSLRLWMLFGKSTGERPERCGVSIAHRSFAMYVFQKCSVPGPSSSTSIVQRSCDLSGSGTAACQMCAAFCWNMWLKC